MAFNKQKRVEILNKYDAHCAYCGCTIELSNMQIDHIIPQRDFAQAIHNKIKVPLFLSHLTERDVNHDDNLNPSCRVCNKRKDAMDLEFFRSELYEQVNRLNKYSAGYRLAKKFGQIEETSTYIIFYFECY